MSSVRPGSGRTDPAPSRSTTTRRIGGAALALACTSAMLAAHAEAASPAGQPPADGVSPVASSASASTAHSLAAGTSSATPFTTAAPSTAPPNLGALRRAAVDRARRTSPAGTALPDFALPAAPRVADAAPPDPLDDPVNPPFPITAPSRDTGSTSALVVSAANALAHAGHGRKVWRVPVQTTWSSQPMILMVLESVVRDGRRWLRVRLPTRPAGQFGWIPYDHTIVGQAHFWVNVDRSRRLVRVYHYGHRVRRFRAVVGAPKTPTPKGLAAIYERNRQPDPKQFLGPWAVALTLTSNVLQEFDGGPGRIGIHGRAGASLADPIGTARSHGCIRVNNDDITWVAKRVPQGTPVLVR